MYLLKYAALSLHTTVRTHTLQKQGLWLSSQQAALNRINPKVFLKYRRTLILPKGSSFYDHNWNIDFVVDPVLLMVSSCAW